MDKKWILLGVIMAVGYGLLLGDLIVAGMESRRAIQERIEECCECRGE